MANLIAFERSASIRYFPCDFCIPTTISLIIFNGSSARGLPGELDQIVALYNQQLAHFKGDVPAACKLIQADAKSATTAPDLAAWTVVANVLLNLDETISKE